MTPPLVRYALPQPYRDLEHTADVGVAVEGATAEEALARLVLAFAALVTGGERVEVERVETFSSRSDRPGGTPAAELTDVALALLRELLFRLSVDRVVPGWCEVSALAPDRAEVAVGLGRYDPERHAEGLDLKAVTRHAARFGRGADGRWGAQVVFDI